MKNQINFPVQEEIDYWKNNKNVKQLTARFINEDEKVKMGKHFFYVSNVNKDHSTKKVNFCIQEFKQKKGQKTKEYTLDFDEKTTILSPLKSKKARDVSIGDEIIFDAFSWGRPARVSYVKFSVDNEFILFQFSDNPQYQRSVDPHQRFKVVKPNSKVYVEKYF